MKRYSAVPEPAAKGHAPAEAHGAPARARRVAAALRAGTLPPGPDIDWFLAGLEAFLQAPASTRLDVQLGLHPKRGQPGWWTLEARQAGDQVIALIDRALFRGEPTSAAARGIVELANKYRTSDPDLPASADELLARFARTCRGMPGERQVANILKRARGNSIAERISSHEFPAGVRQGVTSAMDGNDDQHRRPADRG